MKARVTGFVYVTPAEINRIAVLQDCNTILNTHIDTAGVGAEIVKLCWEPCLHGFPSFN